MNRGRDTGMLKDFDAAVTWTSFEQHRHQAKTPRARQILDTVIRHSRAEVEADVDTIMDTLAPDPQYYEYGVVGGGGDGRVTTTLGAETSVEARLDQIESRAAISQLAARYCRGVDRREAETFASIWHDDAEYLIGSDRGNFKGLEDIKRFSEIVASV